MNLRHHGISNLNVYRNLAPSVLYEHAVRFDQAEIVDSEHSCNCSHEKTGRSPLDKRIVANPESQDDIWWGPVNIPLSEKSHQANRLRAVEFLEECDHLYVMDGFARLGPSAPNQSKNHLCTSLPCSVHAQHADSTDCRAT